MSQMENPIQFTDEALKQIRKSLENAQALGLRMGVKKTGCSGYSYLLEYIKISPDDSLQITVDSIPIFLDKNSLNLLSGCKVDYVKQGLNKKFVFMNPNSKALCGCGESFTI